MARKQCKKCPWKKSTDPYEIPNGYDRSKHEALKGTIAKDEFVYTGQIRIMACHETTHGEEKPCVGWMHHQLGVGNNVMLRYQVVMGRLDGKYKLDGEQHACFEDTLP
jgi:hypothetical protein